MGGSDEWKDSGAILKSEAPGFQRVWMVGGWGSQVCSRLEIGVGEESSFFTMSSS